MLFNKPLLANGVDRISADGPVQGGGRVRRGSFARNQHVATVRDFIFIIIWWFGAAGVRAGAHTGDTEEH